MPKVKPVPKHQPQISPYLCVDGADAAIDFYSEVFGATVRLRLRSPDGKIAHAELEIGDSFIMVSDENPGLGLHGPKRVGGTPVTVNVYVEDVDEVFGRAIRAGAKQLGPVEDQFYGDRSGSFEDPFGHRWNVATRLEDLTEEEIIRRGEELRTGG